MSCVYNRSINLITNPNPFYSHSIRDNELLFAQTRFINMANVRNFEVTSNRFKAEGT
jgi:hypothetical protein